jgi:hypothetical protein
MIATCEQGEKGLRTRPCAFSRFEGDIRGDVQGHSRGFAVGVAKRKLLTADKSRVARDVVLVARGVAAQAAKVRVGAVGAAVAAIAVSAASGGTAREVSAGVCVVGQGRVTAQSGRHRERRVSPSGSEKVGTSGLCLFLFLPVNAGQGLGRVNVAVKEVLAAGDSLGEIVAKLLLIRRKGLLACAGRAQTARGRGGRRRNAVVRRSIAAVGTVDAALAAAGVHGVRSAERAKGRSRLLKRCIRNLGSVGRLGLSTRLCWCVCVWVCKNEKKR